MPELSHPHAPVQWDALIETLDAVSVVVEHALDDDDDEDRQRAGLLEVVPADYRAVVSAALR